MSKKYTEAQKRASLKYMMDRKQIKITVTAAQKDRYRKMAAARGLSLTRFILMLLEDYNGSDPDSSRI